MTFLTRCIQATAYQDGLFCVLRHMGFSVALNGTEHTHPDFVGNLHSSTDQTSLSIRYQPDGVASIGNPAQSIYVEAKDSKTIERAAYEQYMKLRANGNIVVVIFKKLDNKWNFVEDIQLVHGAITVARFPKAFPVDSDGWICPREDSGWLKQLRRRGGNLSATPYREIEPSSLFDWSEFGLRIMKKLRGIS